MEMPYHVFIAMCEATASEDAPERVGERAVGAQTAFEEYRRTHSHGAREIAQELAREPQAHVPYHGRDS
jgi:hypothetical protein